MAIEETFPASNQEDAERTAKLHLIEALCRQFSEFAKPLLNSAFDKADDSLFDQADRSENNSQQQTYFETMRELRVSRAELIDHFFTLFKKGWRPLKAPPLLTGKVSFDELSLLRKDELEELVATEAMVTRIKDSLGPELNVLITRCQHVNDQIQAEEIPFHPKFLCQSFTSALSKIELDINSKLILLKHFDRHLITNIEEGYKAANHLFIQAGVLPDLAPEPTNHSSSRKPSQATTQPSDEPATTGANSNGNPLHHINSFEHLRGLIQGQPSNSSIPLGQVGSYVGNTVSGVHLANHSETEQSIQYVPSTELAQTLGQIQTQQNGKQDMVALTIEQVKHALQDRLADKTLNQVDNDALNLVSMLFEFILDDPQLSLPMKELLGRLQIPMLKVAVLDNSFFSNSKHSARGLLNGLARVGQSWSPKESLAQDKIYQIVAKIVRKVVDDFDQDVSIFSPLNKTIAKLLDHQKTQQQKLESKIRLQEEQNALIKMAKSQAADTLEALCLSNTTPAFLKLFLMNNWVKVVEKSLLLEDSDLYNQAIHKAETLIWSTDAREIIENRSEFLKRIPPLLSEIRDAALEFGFPETNMDALFDNLEQIHLDHSKLTLDELQALEEQHPLPLTAEDATEPLKKTATPSLFDDEDALFDSTKSTISVPELPSQSQAQLGDEVGDVVGEATGEVHATSESNVIDFNRIKKPKAPDHFYHQLKTFEVGMLFELHSEEETERKNLTAIIASTKTYIFVDRHGQNRSEFTEDELASALEKGDIKHLDDGLLFDRALEAVIGSLRKNQVAQ